MTSRRPRGHAALLTLFALALLIAPTMAHALSPVVEFSLRDGPIPNGVADDLILAPDTNFGRVFRKRFADL